MQEAYHHQVGRMFRNVFLHITVVIAAFMVISPFLWMLSTSFKPAQDIFLNTPKFI